VINQHFKTEMSDAQAFHGMLDVGDRGGTFGFASAWGGTQC
jgi:hypothetical protein